MSLKIHVMYQGIIYRVRGIKVLCSVVSAVIILLIAIVSMGIWMLVTAYSTESKLETKPKVVKTPSSITYQNIPENVVSITEQVTNSDSLYTDNSVAKSKDLIFNNEMFNAQVQRRKKIQKPIMGFSDENRVPVDISDLITAESSNQEEVEDSSLSDREVLQASFPIFGLKELDADSLFSEKPPEVISNQPKFRYIHSDESNHPKYDGPPVVGYGRDPYAKLSPSRLEEYSNLWKSYMESRSPQPQPDLIPNVRKLEKPEYARVPVRVRRPPVINRDFRPVNDSRILNKIPLYRRRGFPQRSPLVPPPALNPPLDTPNHKLRISESTNQKSESPGLLRPFKKLYDYSRRLASSLLDFSSKEEKSLNDSSEKFIEDGITLLEDYNKIFQTPGNPLGQLTPSPEKLRSLNPFEMSLITWTFLDYWEFLIEKVGTLSKEDLQLLKDRLDKLKKKNVNITRSLVNQTINHISHDNIRPGGIIDTEGEGRSLLNADSILSPKKFKKFLESFFPGIFPDKEMLEDSIDSQSPSMEITTISYVEKQSRMWDPLGFFSSDARQQFMQYAVKILFNFGKVYLKKPYAVDCTMLLFCKDLNKSARDTGIDGISAKLKSVGLKVLVDKEVRETDTFAEVFQAVTQWRALQCDDMFPKCDGSRALEIVNEVALGTN